MSNKYSRWDGHDQGKEKREGCFEHAAWVSEVLVILLYGVLCLVSMAVRQVEGEKMGRGGESGGWTCCLGPAWLLKICVNVVSSYKRGVLPINLPRFLDEKHHLLHRLVSS